MLLRRSPHIRCRFHSLPAAEQQPLTSLVALRCVALRCADDERESDGRNFLRAPCPACPPLPCEPTERSFVVAETILFRVVAGWLHAKTVTTKQQRSNKHRDNPCG